MGIKSFAAFAAAGVLALAGTQANATEFTLDSIQVIAHTGNSDGLTVGIQNLFTGPQTWDLAAPGADPSAPFNLFKIYTPEGTVNAGEDTVPQQIELKFNFSAPTPNVVDPVTGNTNGYINGFTVPIFGWFIPTSSGGSLVWDQGGEFQMHYGDNLTGLMTIRLNGGNFNQGGGTSTNQGCTFFQGCNPATKGLTVQATLDWDNDPIIQAAAVPEPATWALMIGGFGLAGGALRRRKALASA